MNNLKGFSLSVKQKEIANFLTFMDCLLPNTAFHVQGQKTDATEFSGKIAVNIAT